MLVVFCLLFVLAKDSLYGLVLGIIKTCQEEVLQASLAIRASALDDIMGASISNRGLEALLDDDEIFYDSDDGACLPARSTCSTSLPIDDDDGSGGILVGLELS